MSVEGEWLDSESPTYKFVKRVRQLRENNPLIILRNPNVHFLIVTLSDVGETLLRFERRHEEVIEALDSRAHGEHSKWLTYANERDLFFQLLIYKINDIRELLAGRKSGLSRADKDFFAEFVGPLEAVCLIRHKLFTHFSESQGNVAKEYSVSDNGKCIARDIDDYQFSRLSVGPMRCGDRELDHEEIKDLWKKYECGDPEILDFMAKYGGFSHPYGYIRKMLDALVDRIEAYCS